MIKKGSKVEVIGFGKGELHNPKKCSYNITGMKGTVEKIYEKPKGGLFNCRIRTVKNPKKEIYLDLFHFLAIKLKEIKWEKRERI